MSIALSVDGSFFPVGFSQSIEADFMTFPGGEEHVKAGFAVSKTRDSWIAARITNSSAFMRVAMASDALRRSGATSVRLFMPYIPYARQDRVMVSGEPLSIKVFAGMLNSLKLDEVRVYDPHSDVSPALIDRVSTASVVPFVRSAISSVAEKHESVSIVSPDAGSLKKIYSTLARFGGFNAPLAVGCKIRDLTNGQIIRQEVTGDVTGRACLIIDDIIDGGRTFLELSKLLRDKGATHVYLAVSHGIFSQGTKHLRGPLDGIYVTNSFRDMTGSQDEGFIHQYQLGIYG